jgi:hypothetical protein
MNYSLPKIDKELKQDLINSISKATDEEIDGFFNQRCVLKNEAFDNRCIAKLFGMLYDMDKKLMQYENDLNNAYNLLEEESERRRNIINAK